MTSKKSVYVCFDADSDMKYYRTLQMWSANKKFDFEMDNVHDLNTLREWSSEDTIKAKLRERMKKSDLLMVLVGNFTKFLYKYVRWEIETALKLGLPIIVVNLNKKRKLDEELCPAILRNELAVHISFEEKIITHALNNWIRNHNHYLNLDKKSSFHYPEEFYQSLS